MADKIYKDKIGQGIDQVTIPATQADHVPQFGQTIARTAEIQEVWTGTQADYDLLTPVATTLYFIQ